MIIELNTDFAHAEKDTLKKYNDIDIKLFIDTDDLFHRGVRDGEKYNELIDNPNRMISVGGLYLLEVADELDTWYMGDKGKDGNYYFWGNYGDLQTALESL